jgi:hypothetical protein
MLPGRARAPTTAGFANPKPDRSPLVLIRSSPAASVTITNSLKSEEGKRPARRAVIKNAPNANWAQAPRRR